MPSTPIIDSSVAHILRCPLTGSRLRQEGEELVAVSDESLRYPIDQGVPTLLKDHAL